MTFIHRLCTPSKFIFSSSMLSKQMLKNRNYMKVDATSRNITTSQLLYKIKEIKIIFIKNNRDKIIAKGNVGDSMMDIALKNSIFKPTGWCFSGLNCECCHFIFTKKDFDKLPKPNTFEKECLYDNDYLCTETSRYGCQIEVTEDFHGIEVKLFSPPDWLK